MSSGNTHYEKLSEVSAMSMDNDWYKIAEEDHFWFDWRLKSFLQQLSFLPISTAEPLQVLEIGGGTGRFRQEVEQHTQWQVDIADLNTHAIEKITSGRGKVLLYNILDEHQDYVEKYDVVIVFDVLEHIENTQPFISSVLKHIKPQGFLLVNVPALQCLHSVYDQAMGHYRRYSITSLHQEFTTHKIQTLDTRYWGLALLPLLVLRTIMLKCITMEKDMVIKRGFKPPGKMFNHLMGFMMNLELKFFKKVPLGTSLLLATKKTASSFD